MWAFEVTTWIFFGALLGGLHTWIGRRSATELIAVGAAAGLFGGFVGQALHLRLDTRPFSIDALVAAGLLAEAMIISVLRIAGSEAKES
jgi:hypothetical protein